MADIRYRLFFNNEPASREQLDRVEEISVVQEVDMAWEARIMIPACLDAQGRWQGESEPYMEAFSRIRVEIQIGDAAFVPLIDGPVVGHDQARSAQPGQSDLTVIVRDDSVYLNRNEEVENIPNKSDHEIAEELYGRVTEIETTDIDTTPPASSSLPSETVQRGTAMQLLRSMAQRQGMHAYVLPGETDPGASVGVFKRFPTEASGLPPLVLLGSSRNLESFDATQDVEQPGTVQTFALNISDKGVQSATSSFRNLELLGPDASLQEEQSATRLASPGAGNAADVQQRADAETERSSYNIEATGSTIPDCYPGVLRPYLIVQVRGINDTMSGDYLIFKVTHTLNRSTYAQSFEMKRNAQSAGEGGGGLLENIF